MKQKIELIIKCHNCNETYPITLDYGKNGINKCKKCKSQRIEDITPFEKLPDYLQEELGIKKGEIIHLFPNRFTKKVACGKLEDNCINIISIPEFLRLHKNNPGICIDCKNMENWN